MGGVALRFAVAMFLLALPLLAINAALVGTRPLEEAWPFQPDLITSAMLGAAVYSPAVAVVSLVVAPIWSAVSRALVFGNAPR